MAQDVDVQIKREMFQGPGPNGIDMQFELGTCVRISSHGKI